jgi:formamidopyrimidine-DNA glycosylase
VPELPEMENYKSLLNQKLAGQMITDVVVNREKSINVPVSQFVGSVRNRNVVRIDRRAKHLIFHLDSGKCLLLHLMLGGWMYLGNQNDSPDRTKQIVLLFVNADLYFIGLRLGYLHLLNANEIEQELADLGPEPLDPSFTEQQFLNTLTKRRGMLKTTLVNQKFISGIGNCYSNEICFEARLKPMKKTNELNDQKQKDLYHAIQKVLTNATRLGGYIENPFYKGDSLTGGYNSHCLVYDREGERCNRCSARIIKDNLSSRKTFYCPNCQQI